VLLVAGGQLDPNIGALLRQCLARRIAFRDILVGPALRPNVTITLERELVLGDDRIEPKACFIRHDVFLGQQTGSLEDQRAALNWYHAIRDWALSQPDVRLLNRNGRSVDHGKFLALRAARDVGLSVPPTLIATAPVQGFGEECICKPVAGGELTRLIEDGEGYWGSPYFIQPRLGRPELRVYRIGEECLGFELRSDDLDYRLNHQVDIQPVPVPAELERSLGMLSDQLGLDFAAADFMLDQHGEWVFLEINSQPMFAAFDRKLDGRISDRLIDWLLDTRSRSKSKPATPQALMLEGKDAI
jgi:hypothetical protein